MKQPPEKLIMARPFRQEMLQHAREVLPMEAVGLLGGDADGRVLLVKPLMNLAGLRSFLADPFEQFQAERSIKQSGMSLIAVYHSHPGGGPQLSMDDIAFAIPRPVLHVIVALSRPHALADEIRAYWIKDRLPVPVKIYLEA
jgi:proteasome lid subunit RPN8/RPN11